MLLTIVPMLILHTINFEEQKANPRAGYRTFTNNTNSIATSLGITEVSPTNSSFITASESNWTSAKTDDDGSNLTFG
jgi:hypothetical protein